MYGYVLCWPVTLWRGQVNSVPAKTVCYLDCRGPPMRRGPARLDGHGECVQYAAVGAEHQAIDAEHPAALARDDAQRGQVQAAAWRPSARWA